MIENLELKLVSCLVMVDDDKRSPGGAVRMLTSDRYRELIGLHYSAALR
jgi:hypothetical protein